MPVNLIVEELLGNGFFEQDVLNFRCAKIIYINSVMVVVQKLFEILALCIYSSLWDKLIAIKVHERMNALDANNRAWSAKILNEPHVPVCVLLVKTITFFHVSLHDKHNGLDPKLVFAILVSWRKPFVL